MGVIARCTHVASSWLETESNVFTDVFAVRGVCDTITLLASDSEIELRQAPVEYHNVQLWVKKIVDLLFDYRHSAIVCRVWSRIEFRSVCSHLYLACLVDSRVFRTADFP